MASEEWLVSDAPRITVEELKRRMKAGEDLMLRNCQAWAESDTTLPEAIPVPLEKLEENLPRISKKCWITRRDEAANSLVAETAPASRRSDVLWLLLSSSRC
jgi:hypothetical protein